MPYHLGSRILKGAQENVVQIIRPKLPTESQILFSKLSNRSTNYNPLFSPKINYKLVLTSLGADSWGSLSPHTIGHIQIDPYLDNNFNLIFQKELEIFPYINPNIVSMGYTIKELFKEVSASLNGFESKQYEILKNNISIKLQISESYIAKFKDIKINNKKVVPNIRNIEKLIQDRIVRRRSVYSNHIKLLDITKDSSENNNFIIISVINDINNMYFNMNGFENNSDIYSYIFDRYFAVPDKETDIDWMEKYIPQFFKLYKKMIEREIHETMGDITKT